MSNIGTIRKQLFRECLVQFTPARMIDLGAGAGIFSRIAAASGWEVLAIDARRDRWVPNGQIEFRQQDVRDTSVTGFDLAACLGLFYHLTAADQLRLLSQCAAVGVPIILDTHYALSASVTRYGYQGRDYAEGRRVTSSWGNQTSFWPTLGELHRMASDCRLECRMVGRPYLADRAFFILEPKETDA